MAWSKERRETALVFVDFMNAFLSRTRTYQGPCYDTYTIVSSCMELGQSIAQDARVGIYLNMRAFCTKQPGQYQRLLQCREELDITIVDVPMHEGKDQVDPAIIEDMLRLSEDTEAALPFLLVSADNGFGPTLEELRRKRDAYVGLPIDGIVSNLTKAATGWRWIHPVGWLALALRDHIDGFDRKLRKDPYIRARMQLLAILSRLRPGQHFTNWRALSPLQITQNPRHWMTPNELHFWANAFVFYGIMQRYGNCCVVNAHPLVGRPNTSFASDRSVTTQKPAPQF